MRLKNEKQGLSKNIAVIAIIVVIVAIIGAYAGITITTKPNTPSNEPITPESPQSESPTGTESPQSNEPSLTQINQKGSDTLLVLAQRWAEEYMKEHPEVSIAVSGGGSGTGITALINKQIDMADASRSIKQKEIDEAKANGVNPVEWKVAVDGISVIVNPNNPVKELTLEQLHYIYNGNYTDWSQVGGPPGIIITYGRQSNSGTYVYWQEHVLQNDDYRTDMQTLNGNADIVEAVARDKSGIGYVGIAYATAREGEVTILNVKKDASSLAIKPTPQTIADGSYPISRYLFIYTDGTPTGAVKDYLKWIISPAGQDIVEQVEYIPLTDDVAEQQVNELG